MVTWQDLVEYVRRTYKIAREEPGTLGLIFETPGLRSQMVFLERHVLMGGTEEWLQIWSPIGEVRSLDVNAVLKEMGGMVCGGAAIHGDHLAIRDALPLANLDVNEFERPLILITTTADALEKKFAGTDTY